MLDGRWYVEKGSFNSHGSHKRHGSLLKAKQHCSKEGKCFGIEFNAYSGLVYSINFPIRLKQQQQQGFDKKENVLGNIVYHECLFILEDKNKEVPNFALNYHLSHISATVDTISENQTTGKYFTLFLAWEFDLIYDLYILKIEFGIF